MVADINRVITDMRDSGMLVDLKDTALVLGYEIGDVQKTVFYWVVRGEANREGYRHEFQCAASDALMQLRVLCRLLNVDFSEMLSLGEERLYDRIQDFREKRRPRPDESAAAVPVTTIPSVTNTTTSPPRIAASFYKREGD